MPLRLHPDQIPVDVSDVRRLIAAQFPHLADLAITEIESSGTVNAMFRVGDEVVARLPFIASGAPDIEFEARWLPWLADRLSVRIPKVRGVGKPDAEYPLPWLLLDWIPGEAVASGSVIHTSSLANDLAAFVLSMRELVATGAPASYRTGALVELDADVRRSLAEAADLVDAPPLLRSWEESIAQPAWSGPPTWIHGDLLPGNILLAGGRLAAVLDFAIAGVGDPATDLMPAWCLLSEPARTQFRALLRADDATWSRGRGWSLAQAAIALPYYRDTNLVMAANSKRILHELAATVD